jgi:hypothetical protein
MDYNRAISVSGAAVDTTYLDRTRGATSRMFASAANIDLGYFINNPNVGAGARWRQRLFPLPIYPFLGHYQRDDEGFRIYLADGGHSENLATYSLVRRLCRSIIIVDAGYDPQFEFQDYYMLKHALLAEIGMDFTVPSIDDHTFSQAAPIMSGTIGYFPVVSDSETNNIKINVAYIKLSIDANKLANNEYDEDIRNYYYGTTNVVQWGQTSVFPQESTLDQSYTPNQVLAYHELGCYIITNNEQTLRDALNLDH